MRVLTVTTANVDEVALTAVVVIHWKAAVIDNLHHSLDLILVRVGEIMPVPIHKVRPQTLNW